MDPQMWVFGGSSAEQSRDDIIILMSAYSSILHISRYWNKVTRGTRTLYASEARG